MAANDRQVGGDHYRKYGATGEQHWDRVIRLYPDSFHVYFVGSITAYVERYRHKGGIQDLEKARHYLEKLIEAETARLAATPKYKCGCPMVASDKMKGFCPTHHAPPAPKAGQTVPSITEILEQARAVYETRHDTRSETNGATTSHERDNVPAAGGPDDVRPRGGQDQDGLPADHV